MPAEATKEQFQELVKKAVSVRVVKRGEEAKVKLRTKGVLYTIKVKTAEVDGLLKGLKQPVEEL
jgi:phosphotransacetylase